MVNIEKEISNNLWRKNEKFDKNHQNLQKIISRTAINCENVY